ncbi:MAG: DUF5107 domain-containing protein [Candidatus Aminicenantes bacterium]|nr:DUF5107 domain-containing protein [Candidatus Aminicenantes bacterium]
MAACLLFLVAAGLATAQVGAAARAWEEILVLPTYGVEAAEKNPMFYDGRAYQGAKGPVYPYAFLDRLTGIRQDKAYRAVYLENAYLKLCVLPELGGRLFYAVDKTNDYDFIYRQHVVKPALIGMLGAWISGGVEWNVPHHHRATTFMPVDHLLVNGADGSATVWVGEIERRQRTKWRVGLTLRPDSSAVEVTLRTFNRTPLPQSMLFFANAAIHATPDYQVIFPPDTALATFHGKNQFSFWPISTEIFNGQDYRAGVDVSRLKSHTRPTSFFAFDGKGDFLAGYDHAKEAGVCFVGDHNLVPGKKLWTWGTGNEGALWEKLLTDTDGPYAELMFGAWSDNQPDYSWTRPYETRIVRQYWYPLRGIGGVKAASREAACDLTIGGGKARFAFYATRDIRDARAVLSSGVVTLHEERISLGPGRPFVKEMPWFEDAPGARNPTLSLWTQDGRLIVRYVVEPPYAPGNGADAPYIPRGGMGGTAQPGAAKPVPAKAALPAPVTAPPSPKDVPTVEELYLTGLRLEQFHNPSLEPEPYYIEALRRDPGDYRTNTALGILDLKRGLYAAAETKLAKAVERATGSYTRPKDGEALFCLGLARRALGQTAEAEDAFQRASWDDAWTAAAFTELAFAASRAGDYADALEHLDRAVAKNAKSPDAAALMTALLRKIGALDKARAAAQEVLALDPLDFWGWNETGLIRAAQGGEEGAAVLRRLAALMRDEPANYLELASDYIRCGLWDEAAEVLRRIIDLDKKGASDFPLVHYMLAWILDQKGDKDGAAARLRAAAACPADYGFPFQLEFIEILRWAQSVDPKDARAPYYLGNLLFDIQPAAALAEWGKAAALDPKFPTSRRNLGWALARVKNDLVGAIREYEAALAVSPGDPKLHEEIDRLYEAAGVLAARRLALLEKDHKAVALRDDALAREIKLLVQTGKYDRALDLLQNRRFHVWEGGGEIHGVFVEAHLLRGENLLEAKKYGVALKDFEAALTYPENLEVAAPAAGGGSPRAFYLMASAQAGIGDAAKARLAFEKAASWPPGYAEGAYYTGMAMAALGRGADANGAFEALRKAAEDRLKSAPAVDFFEKFGERQSAAVQTAQAHYLLGLAKLGLGDQAGAAAEFKAALAANPNHAAAARILEKSGK